MSTDMDRLLGEYIDEYGTWEALAEQIQSESRDPHVKAAALAAIPKMAGHLGRNWPAAALCSGHPLAEIFTNRAPWTRSLLCQVGQDMDVVAKLPRWAGLRKRIRRHDQAMGALFELQLAARALSQGLLVLLEPPTAGHRADLAIFTEDLGPDTVYVEATRLKALPQSAFEAEDLMDRVFSIGLEMAGIVGGGRFLRRPTESELPDLLQRVEGFWGERQRDRSAGEPVVPGLLEIWAADQADEEAANRYLSRGYPAAYSFTSAPVEMNFPGRIGHALNRKSQQLRAEYGGMIVLEWTAELELLRLPVEVICGVLAALIQRHRHVNAVALIRQQLEPGQPAYGPRDLGGGHLSVTASHYPGLVEEIILIRNPARIQLGADKVIERLLGLPG